MKLHFHIQSFLIFIFIFVLEVCIALFVDDWLIRPYGGDFLVVGLLYFFFKTFIATHKAYHLVLLSVGIAFLVELAQLLDFVTVFNIKNKLLRIVIGSSFSWGDLLAYVLGGLTCYLLERNLLGKQKSR